MLQILTHAAVLTAEPPMSLEMTKRLYRAMVFARAYDRKSSALQRQGRFATYSPFEGQEAAQVGSAAALEPDDWMVASYRDAAAMWMQGFPMELLMAGRTGDERGGHAPEGVNVLPPSITVGAHMLHAVGLGWASKLKGDNRIAVTYFGDGATSEGDFHEAMNLAAVFEAPTVFVCQNNGWAISLPTDRQTRSETIAEKAAAYGMPGVQVDGNDLYAVYQATKNAVDRARSDGGPTLIEAVTYRIGPHTTTDDPGRYRDVEDEEAWRRRDPLKRVRVYLSAHDEWDEDWQAALEIEATSFAQDSYDLADSLGPVEPSDIAGSMFEQPTPQLIQQAREAEDN